MTRAVLVLLGTLVPALLVAGCSFVSRVHFGDIFLEAGHGLAMMGNHVAITLH